MQRVTSTHIVAAGVILLLVAFVFLRSGGGLSAGVTVPNFTLATLDGGSVTIAETKGHIVVLNFFGAG